MQIRARQERTVHIIELEGDVDFHSSPKLRQQIQDVFKHPDAKMVVDLKKVNYIDSSGLATFVEALQKVKRGQGKMVLANLAPSVRGVFEIAKLDQVFQITGSEQEALQLFPS